MGFCFRKRIRIIPGLWLNANRSGRTRFWTLVGESDEPSKMPLVAGDFLNPNPPSIPNDTKNINLSRAEG